MCGECGCIIVITVTRKIHHKIRKTDHQLIYNYYYAIYYMEYINSL